MKKPSSYVMLLPLFEGEFADHIQHQFMLRYNTEQKRDIFETRAAQSKNKTRVTYMALGREIESEFPPMFLLIVNYIAGYPLDDESIMSLVKNQLTTLFQYVPDLVQTPIPMELVSDIVESQKNFIGGRYESEKSSMH